VSIYFISGIDTDIGKTVAVGLLARYCHQRGITVITVKLVQTGNLGFSEDLQKHREFMGVNAFEEDRKGLTAPQIFCFPASPHLAARLENRSVDLETISTSVATLAARFDLVLVEGAGGLAVPLTEDVLTIDFARQMQWPVILVTSGKLGSINHTILAYEALFARNMTLAGTLYNYCPTAHPRIDEDTPRMLQHYLRSQNKNAPLITIPKITRSALPDIDFSALFAK